MRDLHVGVQLHPQATTMNGLRDAWRAADEMGADSIWTWDHFFPLYGDADAAHFEGWTTLAAMAADTERARVGMLVSGNSYRNPELLVDMARTVDHISGGRAYLGVGSGWFERDYEEYGYEFGTAVGRLRQLGADLPRMRARLVALNPPPLGELPLLIGGSGEKITLKLVAQYADAWNSFGPPETYAHKASVLDDWCAQLDRDPGEIERTVAVSPDDVDDVGRYVDAGATHVIVMVGAIDGAPFDLSPLARLIEQRDA